MSDTDQYIKLERVNDWGSWYVRRPVGKNVPCRFGESIPFRDGQSARIRYPSGATATVTVVHAQTDSMMVGEHGRCGADLVTSVEPGFWADVEGVFSFVPLHRVEVHAEDIPPERVVPQ